MGLERFSRIVTAPAALALALAGCAGSDRPQLPPATFVAQQQVPGEQYIIGPLDKLNIFVRSEEHTSELQSLMRISYAVFCSNKKTTHIHTDCLSIKDSQRNISN